VAENSPIQVSEELIQQWCNSSEKDCSFEDRVAFTLAAQWGADQELEACVDWISKQDWTWTSAQLRAARRPKQSLKEQALRLIDDCTDPEGDYLDDNALSIIRRALEALPND